jgi:hypothetical protein
MLNCIQRNVQVHVTQENSSSLTYSSDFERYYYFNPESGKSSWDYPSGKGKTEDGDSPDGVSIQEHSALDEKLDPVPSVSTPPPGVDITKDPPESIEMWQGPPPPPPPLEEGEVPPTPPSPPHISDESSENEEEEEEAAPYVVAAQPQIYYGPSIPSKEENERTESPSESREQSPTVEGAKKTKKKVLKVKVPGKKGKTVSSLLQKWTSMQGK